MAGKRQGSPRKPVEKAPARGTPAGLAEEDGMGLKARVVDTNALAIIVADADLNMSYMNAAFQEMSGFSGNEVIGKNPRMLYSSRNGADVLNAIKNVRKDGHWQGEVWGQKKGGGEYPAWIYIQAIRGDKGHITHYAATLFDITIFKQN